MEWQGKGIERGMEIVVTPRLCTKQLDGGIKRGGNGNENTQYGWYGRVDIVEMNDIGLASQQAAKGIGSTDNHAESEEYQQVGIRKDINKLRDGVVWRHARQQLALVNPALNGLVVGHLHPYTVYGICRNRHDICHNDALTFADIERVECQIRQGISQRQLGSRHNKVVVLRIVMSGRKGDGVHLLLGVVPRIRCLLTAIVAGGK